jgi:hypothetical protein
MANLTEVCASMARPVRTTRHVNIANVFVDIRNIEERDVPNLPQHHLGLASSRGVRVWLVLGLVR